MKSLFHSYRMAQVVSYSGLYEEGELDICVNMFGYNSADSLFVGNCKGYPPCI